MKKSTCSQTNSSDGDINGITASIIQSESKTNRFKLITRPVSDRKDQMPFKCKVCSLELGSKFKYEFHMKTHSTLRQFQCSDCGKMYKRKSSLLFHMKSHLAIKPFVCNVCSKSFRSNCELKVHSRYHTGEKPFMCSQCGKCFITNSIMNRHSSIHHKDKRKKFFCEKCGKQYLTKTSYINHMSMHKGDNIYPCRQCDKSFYSQRARYSHIHVYHSGKERLCCTKCGKECLTQTKLEEHMRNHTGEKPFACTEENCGKTFSTKTGLQRHLIIHSGEKPFECKQCDKKFAFKSHYNFHMKKHEVSVFYECTECGNVKTYVSAARKHVLEDHLGMKWHKYFFRSADVNILNTINNSIRKITKPVNSPATNKTNELHVIHEILPAENPAEDCSVFENLDRVPIPFEGQIVEESSLENVVTDDLYVNEPQKIIYLQSEDGGYIVDSQLTESPYIETVMASNEISIVSNDDSANEPLVIYADRIESDEKAENIHVSVSPESVFFDKEVITESQEDVANPEASPEVMEEDTNKYQTEVIHIEHPTKGTLKITKLHLLYDQKACQLPNSSQVTREETIFISLSDPSEPPGEDESNVTKIKIKNDIEFMSVLKKMNVSKSDQEKLFPNQLSTKSALCDECGKSFINPSSLTRHMKTHRTPKQFSCTVCDVVFHDKTEFSNHNKEYHFEKKYKCPHCDKSFHYPSALQDHSHLHTGEKPYMCSICGLFYGSQGNLRSHMQSHCKVRYQCEICHKVLYSAWAYKDHKNVHSDTATVYKCPDAGCEKVFRSKKDFKAHIRCHNNRKHVCEICKKTFMFKTKLKEHMSKHTGFKPYECKMPNCEARFATKTGVERHTLCHSGVKEFACDICGKQFAFQYHLTAHKTTHTGEKKYKCKTCGKRFTRSAGLKKHLNMKTKCTRVDDERESLSIASQGLVELSQQ